MADNVQLPDSAIRSLLAPIFQPGAQFGLTQQETSTSAQSEATSAQDQKTSAQSAATSATQNENLKLGQPGIKATSDIDQLNAIKAAAPLNLAKSIQGGMTWDQARKRGTSLGMSADDVFKSYLSNNIYGAPKESPDTLQQQGVKAETLGQVGQTGSFNDKYNQRNAIEGVRTAEGLWNKITSGDIMQYKLTGKDVNINNYQIFKNNLGNHLSSLIPGASNSEGTGKTLLSQLPDATDPGNYFQGIGQKAFPTIENSLLTMKNYTPQELGLTPRPQEKINSTGGDLLNNILNTVKSTNDEVHNPLGFLATAQIKSGINDAIDTTNKVNQDISQTPKTGNPLHDALSATGTLAKDTITPQRVAGDIIASLGARYAPTVLSKILGDGGSEATAEAASATPKTGTPQAPKTPGNFMTKIHPQGTMDAGRTLKNTATSYIDKKNLSVSGDNINEKLQSEAENLHMQFSGISKADIEQALTNVEDSFKGKNLTGAQAEKIYDGIPSGYTATGIEKEDFNSQLAQLKRQAISDEIENTAKGKGWAQGVQAQGKAFKAQKGQVAKTKQNILPRAIGAGLGIAGLDTMRHVLGL